MAIALVVLICALGLLVIWGVNRVTLRTNSSVLIGSVFAITAFVPIWFLIGGWVVLAISTRGNSIPLTASILPLITTVCTAGVAGSLMTGAAAYFGSKGRIF